MSLLISHTTEEHEFWIQKVLSKKVQQGLEVKTTITDKCPKTKPYAESVSYPANIFAKCR